MSKIERKKSVVESLAILPCPLCGGEVDVKDCGYTTFNPGSASCKKCKTTWKLGLVDDRWDAGIAWNKAQPFLLRIADQQAELQSLLKQAGLPSE